ncbi:MAG TPA: hypothetical protein PK307_02715 [Spirochaetota bacterium]|nr:hypothetical protein [Spirochaetota bacterium]HOD13629.1 hypothetical protein [Spirochaetota bacterium]HPG50456.1 hypothetical protein [Spirochaetota bacterium]HPN12016.1 hypothetical protein [Spirochaetota bacterium]HQL81085.1 hypothetical protein [Spirochaetota bacterium]
MDWIKKNLPLNPDKTSMTYGTYDDYMQAVKSKKILETELRKTSSELNRVTTKQTGQGMLNKALNFVNSLW